MQPGLTEKWCPGEVGRKTRKGHLVAIEEFNKDAARKDGLSGYCKLHSRKAWARAVRLREEAYMEETIESQLETSERAIALERAKRREEKEIGQRLRPEPELRVQRTESVFSGLGFLMRAPKGVGHGWSCPVGCVSR